MTKTQIRQLKSHYGSRWRVYRHNQKHHDKKLFLEEKFVVDNVLPGPVLAKDCLGEIYQHVLNVQTQCQGLTKTILLINNPEFKYKTVNELVDIVCANKKDIDRPGRIIVTFSLFFVIYDRLNNSVETLVEQLVEQFKTKDLVCHKKYVNTSLANGVGQIFLSLDCHD
jgi:hypothetical protein